MKGGQHRGLGHAWVEAADIGLVFHRAVVDQRQRDIARRDAGGYGERVLVGRDGDRGHLTRCGSQPGGRRSWMAPSGEQRPTGEDGDAESPYDETADPGMDRLVLDHRFSLPMSVAEGACQVY